MKTFHIKFAIVACTLALTACGAGESETDRASIDAVGSSAYQQALGANGQVDCDRLHNALWDNGIDPAQLEPDVVFEACVNSGTPDDVCQAVAFSCFGGHDCTNPGPQPIDPDCDGLYQIAEQAGLDLDFDDPDEVYQTCIDANFPDDLCVQAYQCFGQPPTPQPPVCDEARQFAEQLNIDVDNMSPDELFQVCLDQGYDDQLCWSIIEQCSNAGQPGPNDPTDPDGNGQGTGGQDDPNNPDNTNPGGTDPNDIACDEIAQRLADHGYQLPPDQADAQVLYGECVQVTNDEALCQAALQCAHP